jgi:hypothetical protein
MRCPSELAFISFGIFRQKELILHATPALPFSGHQPFFNLGYLPADKTRCEGRGVQTIACIWPMLR